MDVEVAICSRRSTRKFIKKPIDKKLVEKIINTAAWAPSACNRQLWSFVAITDENIKQKLADVGVQKTITEAPVAIAVYYDSRYNTDHNANIQSVSAAIQNILLLATDNGLSSLWMANAGSKKHEINMILKVPKGQKLAAFVLLGYSDTKSKPPERRPLAQILGHNTFPTSSPFPISLNPQDWTLEQLISYQQKTSRAREAEINYEYYYEGFPKRLTDFIKLKLKGKTLDMFSYDGTFLSYLKDADSLEMSSDVIEFLTQKCGSRNFILSKGITTPKTDEYYDNILILFKLGRFNKRTRTKIIGEAKRLLKKDGRLFIAFRNTHSLSWLRELYKIKVKKMNSMSSHYLGEYGIGPDTGLTCAQVESLLGDEVDIEKKQGFFFIPPAIERRLPLKFFNRLFETIVPCFCKSTLIIARKK